MTPAIGLALKIGGPLLGAAIIAGAIYAYNESLRSEGRNQEKQIYTEQIQEQAERVKVHEEAQDTSRVEGLERLIKEKDKFNAAMLRENRQLKTKLSSTKPTTSQAPEVIHDIQYIEVEKPVPCVVPNRLVDSVDVLAGVLNQIPYDRVPGGQEATGEPSLQGSSPVACPALVARINELTSRLGNTLIEYRSLSEDAVREYEDYEAWKLSVKREE